MPSIPIHLPHFRICATSLSSGYIRIHAVAKKKMAACPDCNTPSSRVHSYYLRKPRDLPFSDQRVCLQLRVRRFRCLLDRCRRVTFAERFPDFLPFRARRTNRFTSALRHIAFALGGKAGARLACKLAMPTSGDTLIRIILATTLPTCNKPYVDILCCRCR